MNRAYLIKKIGADIPDPKLIVSDQDATDIMSQMVKKHKACAKFYDAIAEDFLRSDVYDTCEAIFNFCRDNISYKEESADVQTVSSPQTILKNANCDCKGYALFCAGILDSLRRDGLPIDWCFRFVSYRIMDATPGHVFVVVRQSDGSEIWVDPVINIFDYKKPYIYKQDRRVYTKKAVKVSGCECDAIGTTAQTGQTILKITGTVAPILAEIPVVGWVGEVVVAAGAVVGFFLTVFGNKYSQSTGVRWLVQKFERFVLGQNVNSDNHVNEADTANAQAWFAMVTGVPMYDQYRYHALRGANPSNGQSLNQTYDQRAAAYMAFPEVAKAGVTFNQALQAAHIADKFNEQTALPGAWAGFLAAPSVIDQSGANSIDPGTMYVDASGNLVSNQNTGASKILLITAAAVAAILFIK